MILNFFIDQSNKRNTSTGSVDKHFSKMQKKNNIGKYSIIAILSKINLVHQHQGLTNHLCPIRHHTMRLALILNPESFFMNMFYLYGTSKMKSPRW